MVAQKRNRHWTTKKKSTRLNTAPHYEIIYKDIAAHLGKTLTESQIQKLSKIEKTLDVLEVNAMLFGKGKTSKITQQMRTYQTEDKVAILQYQQQNQLSNQQTANHFKMSRNTIAKWKREVRYKG